MLEKTLGARVGAKASALGNDFRLPTGRDLGQILLATLALGVAALLFFAWLMPLGSHRAEISTDQGSDCASLGRGGVYCAKAGVSDGQSSEGHDGDCASLGKGGRVCAERPQSQAH